MAEDRWQNVYQTEGRRWGDLPGALAPVAVAHLLDPSSGVPDGAVLDLGCGYGRDSSYLARELGRQVIGVDPSPRAIEIARSSAPPGLSLEYRRGTVEELAGETFAAVYFSNTYHVMRPADRELVQQAVPHLLTEGGLFFLAALAVGDPEHWGTGTPVADDQDSYVADVYLHFSTPASLQREFGGSLVIERTWEHEFLEPLAGGDAHRHRHAMLIARKGRRVLQQ
jgi:SAM-dependent methyltransferase